MNETYQHPGKWHENHINPTLIRFDNTHFIMSHVIKNLEHNAVYEAIVQAKNKYGWNEVIYAAICFSSKNDQTFLFLVKIFYIYTYENKLRT